jgi:molybdate transport system substrate-binding protein
MAMRKRGFLTLLATGVAGVVDAAGAPPKRAPLRLAAASDLKFALTELAGQYRSQSGQGVELNLGSSGQFAQQIRQGLPVDVYMSADEDFVFQLSAAGLTQGRGVLYAVGRIAAVVQAGSAVQLDASLNGLREAWPQVQHFAIANPQHAPYGRAARQALERLGLWEMARPKLVLGENIAQATQFVTSGAAQAGITALSLALAPEVRTLARHVVLPASLHEPLRQRMVLLKGARPGAEDFYNFLQGAPARRIFERYGFAAG